MSLQSTILMQVSFTISRRVTMVEYGTLTRQLTEALRTTNYRGDISITYPVRSRATVIMSDHWLNRYRHNKYIWWTCVLLQLWIFTWPLLWVMTKRWEVFFVNWPSRIYRNTDGTWPTAHDEDTEWVHEGHPTDSGNVRVANMTERDLVEYWRLAIQMAAESRKRGTLTDADRRITQAIEERASQRRGGDNFAVGNSNAFLASATGLLSGVQEVMTRSQTLRGWGGDC